MYVCIIYIKSLIAKQRPPNKYFISYKYYAYYPYSASLANGKKNHLQQLTQNISNTICIDLRFMIIQPYDNNNNKATETLKSQIFLKFFHVLYMCNCLGLYIYICFFCKRQLNFDDDHEMIGRLTQFLKPCFN